MILKKNSIAAITIFILTIASLSYWGYSVFSNRYAEDEVETELGETEAENEDLEKDGSFPEDGLETDSVDEEEADEEKEAQNFAKQDTFMNISSKDCDNGCKNFSDADDKEYCKNICGLSVSDKNEGCESLEDLERDYCYKNQAAKKTDAGICEKIEDKGVRAACQKRVMEDIVDKQMESRTSLPSDME